jgi:threonine/homoserine/homoserine lactone efflux protein
MVWAGVALLGLNLIIEKMAWLHTIIMVGGGLYLCWMGYQMLRGALKKEAKAARAAGRAGPQRPQLPERAADQPGEPESDYLFWLRVLAVCRR